MFSLDEQLANVDRLPGKSKVDTRLNNIGEFMKAVGTIPEVLETKSYIDDTHLKRVAAEHLLRAVATHAN